MLRLSIVEEDWLDQFEALQMDVRRKANLALQTIGIETVAYLRSLTTKLQPPAKKGEGPRPAHPGGWADISTTLVNSYGYEVYGTSLLLYNTAEYAVWLEDRHGYYVISGVIGAGGAGPIIDALRLVVGRLGGELHVGG